MTQTGYMKALSMQSNTPRDIAVIQAPIPEPAPHELRLKVHAVGICGSDVSTALAKPNFDWVARPLILGHEFSAEIDAVGKETTGWKLGEKVCALSVQGCGHCIQCNTGNTQQCPNRTILGLSTAGAMADYCTVDAAHVVPLHDNLSHIDGALIEPLAVASRCVQRACEVTSGQTVAVSGCGIIGLLCALVAKAKGANVTISGIAADAEVRLKKARSIGLETVVVDNTGTLATQLDNEVDILIEASGSPSALEAAHETVKPGGLIGVVATYPTTVGLPATDLVRREQRLHTSFGSTLADYERAMEHLTDGDIPVKQLVETFPLDKAVSAFEASITKATPKAVVLP